ncbi:putative membrane protein [Waddlia chondrophila 2032/99]|uniref:Putative membrane protein n=2 Tax=Waddlia chondrophila TaxID=71667 RepID=D6YV07_WADCW|nr:hypothetical protein [Waddlia chondrophila]ADI37968.1 putative membrane protein [Waddlia chondrophila WSU 86-1044]CCB91892.1 putative membrane protein [Waddlia chondrophila 2032/99]
MLKKFFASVITFALLCFTPGNVECYQGCGSSQQCCKDYGGYIPAAGRAYESACNTLCFSPCLAVGVVAVASLATIIALTNNSGDTGVVIHAHSD